MLQVLSSNRADMFSKIVTMIISQVGLITILSLAQYNSCCNRRTTVQIKGPT